MRRRAATALFSWPAVVCPAICAFFGCSPVGVPITLQQGEAAGGGNGGAGGTAGTGGTAAAAGGTDESCGNGITEGLEYCDDGGNPEPGFGCNDDCSASAAAVCGDGVVTSPEVCDEHDAYCQGCATLLGSCGDGVLQSPVEECDAKGESPTCDTDCTLVECGDNLVNRAAGERCDDAVNDGELGSCTSDCSAVVARAQDATATSCKELAPLRTGTYWLKASDASAYVAYCDMTTDGGGWTLIMRAIASNFRYDDPAWFEPALVNDWSLDFRTANGRSKYRAFDEVAFDELRTSDVDDFARGYTVATSQASALSLFGENNGAGVGLTIDDGSGSAAAYFEQRSRFDDRAWGCRDHEHVGLNQQVLLGIQPEDRFSLGAEQPLTCDWDGGARFGQRVNACHYKTATRDCGGDHAGQGWGNFWNMRPTAAPHPISQLLWVR
jgi:hypothetical protein